MKIKNILFVALMMTVSAVNAVKLMVGTVAQTNGYKTPRYVTVFWKDGHSGSVELRQTQMFFSSPWNRDIVGVGWYDIGRDGFATYYNYPLHIPAVRAPWLKDPWIIISDNGYIRFNIGNGDKEGKVLSDEQKQKLNNQGWEVID